MISNIKKVLAVLVVFSLSMVSAPVLASDAKTIYVGFAEASDSNNGLTEGASKSTIQAAINLADPGDTVQVAAGTYQESITIDKNITLLGPNDAISPNSVDRPIENTSRTAEAIVTPAADVSGNAKAFTLTGVSTSAVTISGFKVVLPNPSKGDQYFVFMNNVPLDELILEKNQFTGGWGNTTGSFALNFQTAGSARLVLEDNRIFSGPTSNGVWVQNTVAGSEVELAVSNNVWLDNRAFAMNITGSAAKSGTISNNWIGNSTVGVADVNGYLVRQAGMILAGAFDGLSVSNNYFINGESAAINLYSDAGGAVRGAISITGNRITGYNNTGVIGAITGRVQSGSPSLQDFSAVVVSGNCFSNPVGSSRAVSNRSGVALNVENNWWGQASGPASGQIFTEFSSQVLSDPWSATDTCAKTWYVASSGNDANLGTTLAPFRNVQTAIDHAVAGDTIVVRSGIYNGFRVRKALRILGPNHLIAPRAGSIRQNSATVNGAVDIVSGVEGVTLSGFSFVASDTSSIIGVDVGSNSRNVSITYNDISGFNQGIRSQGNSLNFGTGMNVSYNHVHGLSLDEVYGSYSILLRNVKASTVSNNIIMDTVTGLSGEQLRRGILLRGAENTAVTNNIVNFGSSASTKATYGIALQQKLADPGNGDDLQVSSVVIRNNTLSGSIWGINLSELDSQARGIVVEGNTARNVFVGVHFRSHGQTGATVVNELLVQKNNFSAIEDSGALSAGVQVFSFDFTPPYTFNAPAINEFDGVVVNGNWLPTGNINQLGLINGLSVGAILNPGAPLTPGPITFHATVLNGLDARGNYWGSATGPDTAGSAGGASITTSPHIASYRNDPAQAGKPGFWPIVLLTPQNIRFTPVSSLSATTTSHELAATATSGLTVAFSSTTPLVCTVSGTTLTPVKVGTCTIRASQAGDSNYAAGSISRSIAITGVAQTITGFSPTTMTTLSSPQTLTATTDRGSKAVTFTTTSAACSISGTSLTAVAPGTCVIKASQAADDKYVATSANKSIAITAGVQTITNFNPTSMTMRSDPQTLSATGGGGSSPVTFKTTSTTCSVVGTTLTALAAGTCVITASQAANGAFATAITVHKSITISKVAQTITGFTLSAMTTASGAQTLSATMGPGSAPVTFKTSSAACTITGNSLTVRAAGSCVVTASRAADGTYAAAPNVTKSITISRPR